MDLINKLEVMGHIRNHQAVEQIIKEIQDFRSSIGILSCYDWISIPLNITQVGAVV